MKYSDRVFKSFEYLQLDISVENKKVSQYINPAAISVCFKPEIYISKLIGRVILEQLSGRILPNSIYEPMQSAYRHGHSTETALLRVQNDTLGNMDRVEILLLLDLSAAFDTVSHRLLLHQLRERIEVQGNPLKWFKSSCLYKRGNIRES